MFKDSDWATAHHHPISCQTEWWCTENHIHNMSRTITPHYLLIITHPSICSQQSPTPHHHLHLNKSKRITNSSPSQTITSYFRYPPSYTACTNHHTQPPTHVLTQLVDDDWMVETDAEFLSGGGRGERSVRPKGRRCKLKSL